MFFIKSTSNRIQNTALLFSIVGILSLSILATVNVMQFTMVNAQPGQPNNATSASSGNSPLKFFIKYSKGNATSTTPSQQQPSSNATAASGGNATKKLTILVNIQKGPSGTPIKLPITTTVPSNAKPQDLQLCAVLASGTQTCQPLGGKSPASMDLTKSSSNSTSAAGGG